MYVLTNGSSGLQIPAGMGRYQGLGQLQTCYYWVQGPNGVPVCGNTGAGTAALTSGSDNTADAQLLLSEVAGQVKTLATAAALMAGAASYGTGSMSAAYAANMAAAAFNAAVSPADAMAGNSSKINSAASAAVYAAGSANYGSNNTSCSNVGFCPQTFTCSNDQSVSQQSMWQSGVMYNPYCSQIQTIMSGGVVDFISLATGTQTAVTAAGTNVVSLQPAQQPTPVQAPVFTPSLPVFQPAPSPAAAATPGVQAGSSTPSTAVSNAQQSSPSQSAPAAQPGAVSSNAVEASTGAMASGATNTPFPGTASQVYYITEPTPQLPSGATNPAPSSDTSGITSWIEANPILSAAIAIGGIWALSSMGGK
jgi:hypothetical protein